MTRPNLTASATRVLRCARGVLRHEMRCGKLFSGEFETQLCGDVADLEKDQERQRNGRQAREGRH